MRSDDSGQSWAGTHMSSNTPTRERNTRRRCSFARTDCTCATASTSRYAPRCPNYSPRPPPSKPSPARPSTTRARSPPLYGKHIHARDPLPCADGLPPCRCSTSGPSCRRPTPPPRTRRPPYISCRRCTVRPRRPFISIYRAGHVRLLSSAAPGRPAHSTASCSGCIAWPDEAAGRRRRRNW